MTLWNLSRVPEPEVMEETDEVESYASAAAERHLEAIDNTFVEHLLKLLPKKLGRTPDSFWGLDIGTGPGQIPIRILGKIGLLNIIGLDRSPPMLAQARRNAERAGVSGRLRLAVGDGHSLPFPQGMFSIVICNSVLHHAREPVRLLREMFRVAAPGGVVLLRDLRRPSRLLFRWHLWRHGRHYRGRMRQLFEASVRASYTRAEMEELIRQANLEDARSFRFRGAHIGLERPGQN